jgi:hypothetical protein
MIFILELNFHNLKKKGWCWSSCLLQHCHHYWIDIFLFHITIISNLVISSYTDLLVLNEPLKNENKDFLEFLFFLRICNLIS